MCPYFYVIAQNFVVLFLLKGFAGTQANTVYVTPTTTGLRKALRSEGIFKKFSIYNICHNV